MKAPVQRLAGQIVDLHRRRIFPGVVEWAGGRIVRIREDKSVRAKHFIAPGFVDAHIHIESSMLPPAEFARWAVVHGTAVASSAAAMNKPLLDVFASLIVERDSQKGIVIGHRGSVLREIGTAARAQLTALLGTPVHLDLKVKVLKDWQRNAKHLNRLGF